MTSIPTSLRRSLILCEATSPMCATNFSFSLSACEQPSHGQRLVTTLRRSRWNARCMPAAAWVTASTGPPLPSVSASRDRNAASPSISISSNWGAASITASSSRAVFTSAWARLIRCVLMYSVYPPMSAIINSARSDGIARSYPAPCASTRGSRMLRRPS